jgi:inosine-uridine nucleoside N-ribohydrolase
MKRSVMCVVPACLGLVLGSIISPVMAGAEPADSRSGGACLLVDTDVALDDLRALAELLPQRTPTAIVVTEGISSVPRGSTAVATYLGASQAGIPVIQGDAASSPPNYSWLPPVRADDEVLNGFLASPVAASRSSDDVANAVREATRRCDAVDVLALGPWTSFVHYAPALGTRLHRVVASGRPIQETNPDDFNCEYDLASCRAADVLVRATPNPVWVDLSTDDSPNPSYAPTQATVNTYNLTGLPGVLRALLNLDPSQWLTTRLWDDSAALYLLDPNAFAPHGGHLEPAVDAATLRALEIQAVNTTPRF